jgi:preprotein translocase subunit SecA
MFEAMMMRFQEDTARHLFRMQILAPDGTPINTPEELARLQAQSRAPQAPPLPSMPRPAETHWQPNQPGTNTEGEVGFSPLSRGSQQGASAPGRAPSTTIDALEREFERKKHRELEAARMAGGSNGAAPIQQRSGKQIGRNEPCFCGSGKKYKKCHGANA